MRVFAWLEVEGGFRLALAKMLVIVITGNGHSF